MATRRRILLLSCALAFGAVVAPASLAAAAPRQDPGATFGTGGAETTTTVAVSTTAATTDPENGQTLVESEELPEKAIFTESRKVAAVIGGLVLVALAILLLTIRYIRVTKPVARPATTEAPEATSTTTTKAATTSAIDDLDDDSLFVDEPSGATAAVLASLPGTDHASADADWEPRTDEHQRVEIPGGTPLARPSAAARRKALGSSPN